MLAVPHYAQLLKGRQNPHSTRCNLMHVVVHSVRDYHYISPGFYTRMINSIDEKLDRLEGQNIDLIWSQTLDKTFDLLVSVVVPQEMRINGLLEVIVERLKVISASI